MPRTELSRLPHVTALQATAFRLHRQHLVQRRPASALHQVLADMNGAQAQLLPAALLALWARVHDIDRDRLDDAIWVRRTVLRAWCMRRTLYLLPSKDAALYCRGSARRAEKEIRWMLNHGASVASLEDAMEVLLELLNEPRSREELADLLSERLHVPVESRAGGTGWGSRRSMPWIPFGGVKVPIGYALHLIGARSAICLGPARGAEATYLRADAWSRSWRELSQGEAEDQLLQRYLRSFGPATPHDFAIWTGMTLRDAHEIWSRILSRLTRVNLAGHEAWILRKDLSEMLASSLTETSLRLLPHFDGFLLGHRDHGNVVRGRHHSRVFRKQGWVSPVLLIDGAVAGVWGHTAEGDRLRVRVEPFDRLPRTTRFLIDQEARSLARFLGYGEVQTLIG